MWRFDLCFAERVREGIRFDESALAITPASVSRSLIPADRNSDRWASVRRRNRFSLGPDRIFIERAGLLQQVQDVFLGEKSLMVAVKNIARRLGDDISESKPILDSRLPDGSRVAAVIPPCSLSGVTL